MKKFTFVMVIALACALLAACGAGGNAPKNGAGTAAVSLPEGAGTGAETYNGAGQTDEGSANAATDASGAGSGQVNANGSGAENGTDAKGAVSEAGILDIGEKMFVGQMNDIYANTADYIGKTIRYEGFFTSYADDSTGTVYNCIVRNGPGCCGFDSVVGFEFKWDGSLPKENDWCRITGAVSVYKEDGFDYIQIQAQNLETLPVRGNDTVTQ